MSENYVRVLPVAQMPATRLHCTVVDGVPIALCRVGDAFHAVSNQCTHAMSTFDDGRMRAHRLICPLHGAMFDVRNGQPFGKLAREPLTVFPTRISADGYVEVQLPAADS